MTRSGGNAERDGAPLRPREDFFIAERPGYLLHKAALLLRGRGEGPGDGGRTPAGLLRAGLAGRRAPSFCQQDLSRLLNLDPTTVVTVIDEMERNQHVERRRNPADRRRYNLILTDAGRAALAAVDSVVTEVETAFFGTLDDDEREVMRRMLDRMLAGRWPASVCSD
ncbi:MarR family winged helix-turn-helix transcriptional regulator [Streptomyces hirsutus]